MADEVYMNRCLKKQPENVQQYLVVAFEMAICYKRILPLLIPFFLREEIKQSAYHLFSL